MSGEWHLLIGMKHWFGVGCIGLALSTLSCGVGAQGPRVRVATASAAELEAVKDEDTVWYEFQPGDVIPVHFGFLGAVEGGSDKPAVFRAKQRFFFVTSKQGPMRLSFDGETFAGPRSSQSVILVAPRQGGEGGSLVWAIYMGESGDAEGELERILADTGPAEPAASEAPATSEAPVPEAEPAPE